MGKFIIFFTASMSSLHAKTRYIYSKHLAFTTVRDHSRWWIAEICKYFRLTLKKLVSIFVVHT